MGNTTRILVGLIGAALLATLAVPEVSAALPPGVAPALAAAIAAVLHQINPKQAKPEAVKEEP